GTVTANPTARACSASSRSATAYSSPAIILVPTKSRAFRQRAFERYRTLATSQSFGEANQPGSRPASAARLNAVGHLRPPKAGWTGPLLYESIAEELGLATASAAFKADQRGIAKLRAIIKKGKPKP